jgi:hypothetical protein
MTIQTDGQNSQPVDNKELNFRKQQAMYERMLQEKENRIAELQQQRQQPQQVEEDDDDNEPYIDKKKLDKKLNKFGQQQFQVTQSEIQKAVHTALQEERKQTWMKNNPDYYDVMGYAEKFAMHDPELAETILTMPEGFERNKLVYKNIKALGLHKAPEAKPSIQDKIDANRRSPYYQPGGNASPAYAAVSDFSPAGQKQAHDKLLELKNRLRL